MLSPYGGNKAMSLLTSFIQHCTGGPVQHNKEIKRIERMKERKKASKKEK